MSLSNQALRDSALSIFRAALAAADPRAAVDRAMRTLGLVGVRRGKKVRTTIVGKDGKRAGDLLDRDFTAPAPNRVWVTDFTYVRTWAGFVYVAFILDVYAQRIIAWHASSSKATDLVMTPLRMALRQRDHEGRAVDASALIHHSDAGSQTRLNRWKQHLLVESTVAARPVPLLESSNQGPCVACC